MNRRMAQMLERAKASVMAGNAVETLKIIEEFTELAGRQGITSKDKEVIENRLSELRQLAEASARGAKQAIEQAVIILQAARSLQTYDETGRKQSTTTGAPAAQRF